MELTAAALVAACADDAEDAGLLLTADLEPVAGSGTPVKPAVYAGGRYQQDQRWVGTGSDRAVTDIVVIDNTPSQANRLEAQLERLAKDLGLPNVVIDLSGSTLPPHLPDQLSGFRFPHRNADAYLRDALLDGTPFLRTEIGEALRDATAHHPGALLQWFPQALLFGFWQSHLGKKGSQAKLARSWVSEIVGISPATVETRVLGLKGDPLNLSVTDKVSYDENDQSSWQYLEGAKKVPAPKGSKVKQESLAELGHGQVPADGSLGALSFAEIVQRSSVSFAALRRIDAGSPEASAAARALLVGLGLVAHVAAFGRPFSLRSGCELRPRDLAWTWLGPLDDTPASPTSAAQAATLFRELTVTAQAKGLPVGSIWRSEPLVLTPNEQLAKVIAATYPSGE